MARWEPVGAGRYKSKFDGNFASEDSRSDQVDVQASASSSSSSGGVGSGGSGAAVAVAAAAVPSVADIQDAVAAAVPTSAPHYQQPRRQRLLAAALCFR